MKMEERKLDGLHGLQEEITTEFPQLDCHLDSNQDVFLKVTSKSSVSHGLRYLPNFHVIFTWQSEGSLIVSAICNGADAVLLSS